MLWKHKSINRTQTRSETHRAHSIHNTGRTYTREQSMSVGKIHSMFFFPSFFYTITSLWRVWLQSQLTLLSRDEMMRLLSSVYSPPAEKKAHFPVRSMKSPFLWKPVQDGPVASCLSFSQYGSSQFLTVLWTLPPSVSHTGRGDNVLSS